MSPKRANSLLVRDNLIRNLTPLVMRAVQVDREVAKSLLAEMNPDQRWDLWLLRSRAMNFRRKP